MGKGRYCLKVTKCREMESAEDEGSISSPDRSARSFDKDPVDEKKRVRVCSLE